MDRMTDEKMREEQRTMQQLLAEAQEQLTKAQRLLVQAQAARRWAFFLTCGWMVVAVLAVVLAAATDLHSVDLKQDLDRSRGEVAGLRVEKASIERLLHYVAMVCEQR